MSLPPQLWFQVFILGVLSAAAGLTALYLYQKGMLHFNRIWGSLRMKFLYRHTEKRRKKGREKAGMTTDPMPILIAGLGNPGREYRESRHNIGFKVLDALAADFGQSFGRVESQALVLKHTYHGKRLILAKPQTFMNQSGRSVGALARFYKIDPACILVISDDLDLPPGKLRLRPSGGSGGHRGLQSINQHLGTDQFPRLRIGIGRPPGSQDPANYVLHRFSPDEQQDLEIMLMESRDCVFSFLDEGIDTAMNRFNPGQASNGTD